MLAIVAPGQGAQAPGFLAPWLSDSRIADRLAWLSAVAGLDLAHYGTEADAETIRDTAIAQPLLVGSALVALRQLLGDQDAEVDAFSGH
ncbi:MAG: ACP S-malonyltransferase, partial [Propionicimonas sp.]